MVDWKEGNIKEVARVLHEQGNINDITYLTTPNSVIFLSDGWFVGCFEYRGK